MGEARRDPPSPSLPRMSVHVCAHVSKHMRAHAGVFEGLLLTDVAGFSNVGSNTVGIISLAVLGLVVIPYPIGAWS